MTLGCALLQASIGEAVAADEESEAHEAGAQKSKERKWRSGLRQCSLSVLVGCITGIGGGSALTSLLAC